MKRTHYVALSLLVGALLASLLLDDPGRISLRWHGWWIDLSLPLGLLIILGLMLLIRAILRSVRFIREQLHVRATADDARSYEQLAKGLMEFAGGNWQQAEQTLSRSAFGATYPAVHYLAAARAAELQNALARRDEWLAKALDAAPGERASVHVSHAEMLLKHNQLAAARTLLEQLDVSGDHNARSLGLLARIYRQQGDWQQLKVLEPRLRNLPGLDKTMVDEVLVQVHLDALKAAGTADDIKLLDTEWRDVPKSMTSRADIVVTYARAAMQCRQYDAAEQVLRTLLNEQWDESVVQAYGDLTVGEPGVSEPLTLLQTTEKWLLNRPEDATLLYTCARCCIRNELYGKARSYLEASIGFRPRPESYQLLAQLLELSGERERAFKVINDALTHAVGRKSPIPKLRAQRFGDRRRGADRRGTR